MRTLGLLLVFCLALTLPAWAAFCESCGAKLSATAKFCPACGAKVAAGAAGKSVPAAQPAKPAAEPAKPATPADTAAPTAAPSVAGEFRTKTDLYLYERRGDEHNVLKKNLFFKPRRYKISRDVRFKILEYVGDTLLVQTIPDANGKIQKGWVTEEELLLRSDWTKK